MSGFFTALQFLTIIRIRKKLEVTAEQLAGSMAYFPLAGLVIGIILAGTRAVLASFLPQSIADVLVIATLAILTGSLHLDGFADVVDGLAGGRNKERILAIMKDSRIGSFAVVGLVLLLLVKTVALIEVPADVKTKALIAVPVLGRWATVQLASFFEYARSGPGTARAFATFAGMLEYGIATVVTALVVVGLFLLKGVVILIIVAATVGVIGLFFKRRIGGVTGDVMGAACELSEVVTLIVVCALYI
jgi:adenosylcobinamide-GDP ribazoletransferase